MPEIKEVLIGDENQEKINKGEQEESPLVDLDENQEAPVPREVESWLEKIEEEPDKNQQQNQGDDDSVLQPIYKVQQTILPTNKKTFSGGFNQKISHAGRWLSEFVLRIIKREKGKVKFK
jgi:hypothetical protein